MFDNFDSSGAGHLTVDQLRAAMKELGLSVPSKQDMEQTVRAYDQTGLGLVRWISCTIATLTLFFRFRSRSSPLGLPTNGAQIPRADCGGAFRGSFWDAASNVLSLGVTAWEAADTYIEEAAYHKSQDK